MLSNKTIYVKTHRGQNTRDLYCTECRYP